MVAALPASPHRCRSEEEEEHADQTAHKRDCSAENERLQEVALLEPWTTRNDGTDLLHFCEGCLCLGLRRRHVTLRARRFRFPHETEGLAASSLRTGQRARSLNILPTRRLNILPTRRLNILPTRGLDVLTARGLDVLTARRLNILPTRRLNILPTRGLNALTARRLDLLTTRSLHILPTRRLNILPTRGLNI